MGKTNPCLKSHYSMDIKTIIFENILLIGGGGHVQLVLRFT